MLFAILYFLSALFAPASPLVSMTVVPQPYPDHLDVVVYVLNSDPRYTDFTVDVAGTTTSITAPLHIAQAITTTLPLTLPPTCNAQTVYGFVVTARVLTDTASFARTDVGGVITRLCPLRAYLPM